MSMRFFIAASAISTFTAQFAFGAQTEFLFELTPDQEIMPVASNAFGFGYLLYDSNLETFSIDLTVEGISTDRLFGVGPNNSPVHIHFAPAGSNGPIVIDLGHIESFIDVGANTISYIADDIAIGGVFGGISSDPAANEQALFAGNLYVNVHTNEFNGGEVRGQIVPAPATLGMIGLGALGCATRRRR